MIQGDPEYERASVIHHAAFTVLFTVYPFNSSPLPGSVLKTTPQRSHLETNIGITVLQGPKTGRVLCPIVQIA